jgi:gliding motility-associated-like protein
MDQSPASATYAWVIKGGNITTKDPSLTSFANDTFNVFMQITSVSGCFDTVTVTEFTTKVNNFPKILNIDRSDSACAGQTIKYAVNVSPSQDAITNYIWNFDYANGGATVTGVNTQSTETTYYGTAGLFYDSVTVVTYKGCTAGLKSHSLRILATPTNVSINPASDQTICQGTTSTTLQGTGAANYYWTPNIALSPKDSSQTVNANPLTFTRYTVHGYNVFGTYSCEDTASINVFVVPKFNATIKANLNDTICLGDSIILSVEGAPAGSNFFWGPSTLISTFKDSIMTGNPVRIKPIISSPYTVTVIPPSTCQSPQPLNPINIGVGLPININLGLDTVTLASGSMYQFAPNYGPDEVSVIWSPASEFQNVHDLYPSITVKANTCYAVQGTSIFGCKDTAQLCVRSFCQAAQVFIPNAFTPNGNNSNDYFYVTAYGIEKVISFRVFNRWGQVVFERAGYKPDAYGTRTPNVLTAWDGKFKGTIAPTDVYVYTCEVECANGTRFTYTGNVALIK